MSAQSWACTSPAEIGDGWTITTPEAVGLASGELCAVINRLNNLPTQTVKAIGGSQERSGR
jgi:hypothetical protein